MTHEAMVNKLVERFNTTEWYNAESAREHKKTFLHDFCTVLFPWFDAEERKAIINEAAALLN